MLCIKHSGKILNRNVKILKLNFQKFVFFKNMVYVIRFLSLTDFYVVKITKAYPWLLGASRSSLLDEPKTYYFCPLGILYKGKLVTL